MTRYLVKVISKATEKNPNFAGEEVVTVYGKDQRLLSIEGSHADHIGNVKKMWGCDVIEYGYKRECDAKRSWIYKNPNPLHNGFWNEEVSICAVEV